MKIRGIYWCVYRLFLSLWICRGSSYISHLNVNLFDNLIYYHAAKKYEWKTKVHLHRGKHRQWQIHYPQNYPLELSWARHPRWASYWVAECGREQERQSTQHVLSGSQSLGFYLPNLCLHEQNSKMDRVQQDDRQWHPNFITFTSLR